MRKERHIHIGTSGWHYAHWKGPFYPRDLSSEDFLQYYADRLHTVEINNSFYRLPEEDTLRQWHDAVPGDFIFSVKASRYITHMKKLKDSEEPLHTFLGRVAALEGKLGPVLFQLPPRWRSNTERLVSFLSLLPDDNRYAFEFRDPSWFNPEVYRALEKKTASFCIYDLNGSLSPKEVTSGIVYVRLHGPAGPYGGSYSLRELTRWANAFLSWKEQGKDIYCYFDNDHSGYGAQNAMTLQDMVEE